MSDDIDPEIQALIGGNVEEYKSKTAPKASSPASKTAKSGTPDFSSLFGDASGESSTSPGSKEKAEGVDLTRKRIEPVTKFEEETPASYFNDPDFYKKVLAGESDEAQRVHTILTKFIQATDPQDRGIYRANLIPAYWNLVGRMAQRLIARDFPLQKQLAIRYGIVHPNLLSQDQRDLMHRVIFKKNLDEPVYYTDEWLKAVTLGQINPSTSDDVAISSGGAKRDDRSRFNALLQKAQGKRDSADGIMKSKAEERRSLETLLKEKVDAICMHTSVSGFANAPSPYTDQQKKYMSELSEIMRRMLGIDKDLQQTIKDYQSASEDYDEVRQKLDAIGGEAKADLAAFEQEFGTLKNMAKLCVGRQGNHFPVLIKEYFHGGMRDLGTRENVTQWLAWLETIDIEVYCRPYKTALNRIVPFVILVPCYGDYGVCWEPFDIHNRATSRGRIAVPMYPKNLQIAVLNAVADLRWTTAKEKASYYWMEEGLTGNYYQWYLARKLKGDIKEFFIQDYINWVLKESEGIQKLDKEVRGIFWRYMPFSQTVKDKLKTRSFVYQELCQKDQNRSMSQGY